MTQANLELSHHTSQLAVANAEALDHTKAIANANAELSNYTKSLAAHTKNLAISTWAVVVITLISQVALIVLTLRTK